MYNSNPAFIEPADENIKIWRYMDFTKLLSLLETESLYFTRADKFEDPYEGTWTKALRDKVTLSTIIDTIEVSEKQKEDIQVVGLISKRTKISIKQMAINCWHENEHESAAMWKLYLQSNEGIAIQSSFKSLKESLIDDEAIYIGKVKYIDYDTDSFPVGSIFNAFVHKRKSFEHEREIRAVVWKHSDDPNIETIINGLNIKVDVKKLINKIYIAPNAPSWFFQLAKDIIIRYGYDIEVVQSSLYSNSFV